MIIFEKKKKEIISAFKKFLFLAYFTCMFCTYFYVCLTQCINMGNKNGAVCEIKSGIDMRGKFSIMVDREFSNFPVMSFSSLFFPQSTSGRKKEPSRFTARYLLSLMALAGIISELRLLQLRATVRALPWTK